MNCPVCLGVATVEPIPGASGGVVAGRSLVKCSSCGVYVLHATAVPLLEKNTPERRIEIARWIAEERRKYPEALPEVSEGLVLHFGR